MTQLCDSRESSEGEEMTTSSVIHDCQLGNNGADQWELEILELHNQHGGTDSSYIIWCQLLCPLMCCWYSGNTITKPAQQLALNLNSGSILRHYCIRSCVTSPERI